MEDTTSTSRAESTREFYLPATFQFRSGPGRVERFLRRHLRSREASVRPVRTDRRSVPATPR